MITSVRFLTFFCLFYSSLAFSWQPELDLSTYLGAGTSNMARVQQAQLLTLDASLWRWQATEIVAFRPSVRAASGLLTMSQKGGIERDLHRWDMQSLSLAMHLALGNQQRYVDLSIAQGLSQSSFRLNRSTPQSSDVLEASKIEGNVQSYEATYHQQWTESLYWGLGVFVHRYDFNLENKAIRRETQNFAQGRLNLTGGFADANGLALPNNPRIDTEGLAFHLGFRF